jgi:DNA-binding CsgD family transcriptional regulator
VAESVGKDLVYRGVERRRSRLGGNELVVVVDAEFQVRYCSTERAKESDLHRLLFEDRTRLLPEIEALVSKLIAEAGPNIPREPRVAFLDRDSALRFSELAGCGETLYALIVGTNHKSDSLARAAVRYMLTQRQCEVLALVLEGDSVSEIAAALSITENTVHGYIKALLTKTKSRNRPAMVANVLDWNQGVLAPELRADFSGEEGRRRRA